MDREYLCSILFKWLKTFAVETQFEVDSDICDGVVMSEVLCQISPECFDEDWMSKIKRDIDISNWRIKVSNLKKVLEGIAEFYQTYLGKQVIHLIEPPDVKLIAEFGEVTELGKLLQLILGCAVNCERREEYIAVIMDMDEEVQQVLMRAIQELTDSESKSRTVSVSDDGLQFQETLKALQEATETKNALVQRCQELEIQVKAVEEDRDTLLTENKKLLSLEKEYYGHQPDEHNSGRRQEQLQTKVEKFQDEVFRLENTCTEYAFKVEQQEKEMMDIQMKSEELMLEVEAARGLKDEVDILRHTSEKVVQYEATIETLRKKLEEMGDLKRQMKLLEEKNTSYVQSTVDLEEDLRKAQSFKTQADMYKKQVQELNSKLSEESMRADKLDFDNKRLQEKLVALQRENERITVAKDALQEANEELKLSQHFQTNTMNESPNFLPSEDVSGSTHLLDLLPPEVKEKLLRLEHENKMLKVQVSDGSSSEKSELLQSMLDDARVHIEELQMQHRLSNQKNLELQGKLDTLVESQSSAGSSIIDKSNVIEELEAKLKVKDGKISNLETANKKLEEDICAQEQKYRKYLEKARSVIKMLDPKQNPSSAPEVEMLKQQLQERNRLVEHLGKEYEKAKQLREQEEKLVVNAWYGLGMQLHRKAVDEKLSRAGQSFLAKQRMITTPRQNSSQWDSFPK